MQWNEDNLIHSISGGSMLEPGRHRSPKNLAQPPAPKNCFQGNYCTYVVHKLLTAQLDTVVLLVVASQMMRGKAPQIFFTRTLTTVFPAHHDSTMAVAAYCLQVRNTDIITGLMPCWRKGSPCNYRSVFGPSRHQEGHMLTQVRITDIFQHFYAIGWESGRALSL